VGVFPFRRSDFSNETSFAGEFSQKFLGRWGGEKVGEVLLNFKYPKTKFLHMV
jgi:hypothetical protein